MQCSVSVLIRVWKKLENAARKMKLCWEMLGREALSQGKACKGTRVKRTEAEGAEQEEASADTQVTLP